METSSGPVTTVKKDTSGTHISVRNVNLKLVLIVHLLILVPSVSQIESSNSTKLSVFQSSRTAQLQSTSNQTDSLSKTINTSVQFVKMDSTGMILSCNASLVRLSLTVSFVTQPLSVPSVSET